MVGFSGMGKCNATGQMTFLWLRCDIPYCVVWTKEMMVETKEGMRELKEVCSSYLISWEIP
jgi:hypothetical protein